MSVVIRLMRAGAKKRPSYRLVAADSRRQRDGRFLQILGHYDPIPKSEQGYELVLQKDLVQKWLDQGAQPSDTVRSIFSKLGLMKKFQMAKAEARKARRAAKAAEAPPSAPTA